MRLGISSPLAHSSPEEWADKQVRLGCSATVFPLSSDDSEDRIAAYKKAADDKGLMTAEVGIWRNTLSTDEEERRRNIDYSVAQLRLADRLGARCAVNVAGSRGKRWDGGCRDNFSDEVFDLTVKTVREIIDRAEITDTYFTLEPMPWMIPTGPEEYARLIEAVDRERFAVHLDIINMINSADRYFAPEKFIDRCVFVLGGKIRSCHIKDVHLKEEYTLQLEECAPGRGEFPLRCYAEALDRLDGDMPVILEHLDTDEEYITYLAYLKEELHGLYKII